MDLPEFWSLGDCENRTVRRGVVMDVSTLATIDDDKPLGERRSLTCPAAGSRGGGLDIQFEPNSGGKSIALRLESRVKVKNTEPPQKLGVKQSPRRGLRKNIFQDDL